MDRILITGGSGKLDRTELIEVRSIPATQEGWLAMKTLVANGSENWIDWT